MMGMLLNVTDLMLSWAVVNTHTDDAVPTRGWGVHTHRSECNNRMERASKRSFATLKKSVGILSVDEHE